ncbi:MAG: hypothetical protein P9X24_18025 [Candidatus Hatepunaea meridiana]|nr:hypothetical protein [Candidatus Hatepunaea meridiana]
MAEFEVNARGFVGTYAGTNGKSLEIASKHDVLRALITVGYRDLINLSSDGWRVLTNRLFTAIANSIFISRRNRLLSVRRSYYNRDSSEIAGSTYWLGMAFTKLIAERKLQIPWLIHLDRLVMDGVVQLAPDRDHVVPNLVEIWQV